MVIIYSFFEVKQVAGDGLSWLGMNFRLTKISKTFVTCDGSHQRVAQPLWIDMPSNMS